MIAWVDIETTGLEPATCVILEIAVVVTNDDLIIEGSWERIFRHRRLPDEVDPYVVNMHTVSGLWKESAMSHHTVRDGARDLYLFLSGFTNDFQVAMGGSTVHFDRSFLKEWMPQVERWFHYRNLDVSSLKRFASMWRPDVEEFKGRDTHRAMADVLDSIQMAQYYRSATFNQGAPRE